MIGLFDSGHGGLTVLRSVARQLPEESFLFLGDHALAPYGERTTEEIYQLTCSNVAYLFERGCQLVILACNTVSAVALRRLQQTWLPYHYPDRRVLGVLVPVVEGITGVPWQVRESGQNGASKAGLVGIFGTRQTVKSRAYPREIICRAACMTVVQQACPGLVPLIEENASESEIERQVWDFVSLLLLRCGGVAPDYVILGCTHYPLVEWAFRKALPQGCQIISQPDWVARSLEDYLQRHPEFKTYNGESSGLAFETTGDIDFTSEHGSRLFGGEIRFEGVRAAA
jgi:glutamate racemase